MIGVCIVSVIVFARVPTLCAYLHTLVVLFLRIASQPASYIYKERSNVK